MKLTVHYSTFTERSMYVRSAVFVCRLSVHASVCLSVRSSVCNVGGLIAITYIEMVGK